MSWCKENLAKCTSQKKWKEANPKWVKEWVRSYRAKRRIEVITFLGGKCVHCGFSDHRALQIDHVNGDGSKDNGHRYNGSISLYVRVMKDRKHKKYQLLCANCNWIKRYENKEYRT